MNKAERVKMIKAMEFITRQINDEDIFEDWLMNGLADGEVDYGDLTVNSDTELEWETRDENFADLMGCFLRVISRARKSGGLYCDGVCDSNEDN